MHSKKHLLLACLSILLLNSCDKDELEGGYLPIGKFSNRTTAEGEAMKTLINRFSSLPASGFYRVKYEFDDTQIDPLISGRNDHAIWYDKGANQLGVEFDIPSGMTCQWKGVDQQLLKKIADSGQGLEAANRLVNPTNQQENCFKR